MLEQAEQIPRATVTHLMEMSRLQAVGTKIESTVGDG